MLRNIQEKYIFLSHEYANSQMFGRMDDDEIELYKYKATGYNSLTSYHRILHSIPLATEEDDDMLFGKILELICLMYNFNRDLRFALIQDEIA